MKTHRRSTKKKSLLPLVLLFLLISSVRLANVVRVDGAGVDATPVAKGLLTRTQWDCLRAANYVGMEEQIYMPKELDGVQGFPTDADDDSFYFVVISSGDAAHFKGKATDFASHYTRGPTSIDLPPWIVPEAGSKYSRDIARLTLSLEVPPGASILSFDWKFATEELPDEPRFTTMRDWAMATVTTSTGTENILLLPNRKPVDVFTAYGFFNKVTGSNFVPDPPYPEPNDVVFNAVTPIYTAWFDVQSHIGETVQIEFWIADEWDEYRDSVLFLDNLRFAPALGNFKAKDISAIQTVPYVDLILDKPTAFNISYFSSFPYTIETDVRIDLAGFCGTWGSPIPSYTFRTELNPGSNYFYVNRYPFYDFFYTKSYYTESETISFRVTLDPYDVIAELDENDNSVGRDLYGRIRSIDKHLDILFVRLHHENEPDSARITEYKAMAYATDECSLLFGTYPVASVNWHVDPNPLLVKSGWSRTDVFLKLDNRRGAYDRVVGVANYIDSFWNGWDDPDLFDVDGSHVVGLARGVSAMVKNFGQGNVAHEIGHSYGLGDDYDGGWLDHTWGGTDGGTHICATGSGYWVVESKEMIDLQTFMHNSMADQWVDKVDYNILMDRFVFLDPEVLHLSGVIFRDGTAELSEQLRRTSEDEVDIAAGSIGNHYIALLDNYGNTLSRVGFNITFIVLSDPPKEVDKEYFSFTIEWAGGTRLIQLQDVDGNVLATREVSPNPPSVTVNSPNGGEVFTPGTDYTITWSAMDPDGDTLAYNVLISNGVDAKPVPIATGLDQTSFTYDFTNLPGGNQYLIHVEANDGVNIGRDASDDSFTVSFFTVDVVTQAQSISEGDKGTYTLNITSYGGFSGPVTLNAKSSTAPNLMFRWPSGATVAATLGGSITVSMEVEVPAGTKGGDHTIIVSGFVNNNLQMAITNLFVLSHDIAIIDTTLSKTAVNPGDIVSINITVQNQGSFNEVSDVTVYYDNINTIEEQWVYLHAGTRQTLAFMWNTTGVAPGNYTISAYATPIPDETDIRAPPRETDTADNIFTGNTVIVEPPANKWLLVILASAAVIIALVSYVTILRLKRKRKHSNP